MALLTQHLLATLAAFATSAISTPTLPLSTSSRWIFDDNSERVKFRCVNWAGHMETLLPEGLDKQPVSFLAEWIAAQGFNCVRLTYSIDWALNPTLSVPEAFIEASSTTGVSVAAGKGLYSDFAVQNPSLANATTQDVFGEVIDQLWSRGVMTILDNHVSKASWCCNPTDGNGWWDTAFGYNALNSRFFNTTLWLQGIESVATWSNLHQGVVGMSLRNEIRQFLLQDVNGLWDDWYSLSAQAAQAVHAANPDALIISGGISSATDLSILRTRDLDTDAWAGKHVWEFHAYSFSMTFAVDLGSCDVLQAQWDLFDGFVLEQGEHFTAPLFLSEFGVDMSGGDNDGLNDEDNFYLGCLVDYMTSNDAEWAVWALQGTYYARDGLMGHDETWGLLNSNWSSWRNPRFPGMLGAMWNVTQGP